MQIELLSEINKEFIVMCRIANCYCRVANHFCSFWVTFYFHISQIYKKKNTAYLHIQLTKVHMIFNLRAMSNCILLDALLKLVPEVNFVEQWCILHIHNCSDMHAHNDHDLHKKRLPAWNCTNCMCLVNKMFCSSIQFHLIYLARDTGWTLEYNHSIAGQ